MKGSGDAWRRSSVVDEVADPRPGDGQVLVRTLACGICGSDLHALAHGDLLVELSDEAARTAGDGMPSAPDDGPGPRRGHGPRVRGRGGRAGTRPGGRQRQPLGGRRGGLAARSPSGPTGCTRWATPTSTPAATASSWCSTTCSAWTSPTGSDPARAALTEPMAVGLHAVNRSRIEAGQAAVVLGAGPVGLAVIAALARAGAEPIIAADFSPMRRALATHHGRTRGRGPGGGAGHGRLATPRSPLAHGAVRGGGVARHAGRGHARRPPQLPDPGGRACACSPTPCARCWPSARSSTSSSCWATTRWSSPRRCAASPRASSTSPP